MEAAPAEVKAIVETGTGDGASKKRGRAEKREKHLKKRKQKKLEKKQAQSTKAENEGLVTPEMINETVYTFTPGKQCLSGLLVERWVQDSDVWSHINTYSKCLQS